MSQADTRGTAGAEPTNTPLAQRGYLLAWPKLVPPLLQVLVMALVQGLQLLGFVLHQEVTLFILEQIPDRTGMKIGRKRH